MIIPVGSLINFGTIVFGSCLGLLLGNRLTSAMRIIVFQGLGLCVCIIGIQMALVTQNILIVIFSILLGSIIGELCDIDGLLNAGGNALKKLLHSKSSSFTPGFISATLIFCIGSMAILGPLDEGLTGDRSILLTKSMLDGFTSMALAATFGHGVLFSCFPVLILQSSITIFAVYLQEALLPATVMELKATGGILIIGIGLNMLELTKLKLSNFLPAIPCAVALAYLLTLF